LRTIKICALAAVFFAFSGMAWGETICTVESSVELALRENVSVKRSGINLDSLRRKAGKSWNSILPALSVGAGVSKGNESSTMTGYGLVSASITVSPTVIASIEQARLSYEAGEISYNDALRQVELSIRKTFYTLLYEQEYVDQLARAVETSDRQYKQTVANQRAGLVPDIDVLSSQVSLETSRLNLSTAKNALAKDLDSFKQLVGIDVSEPIVLKGSLEDAIPKGTVDLSGFAPVSSSVATIEKSLETARVAKAAALTNVWSPSFNLSMTYRPTKILKDGTSVTDAGSLSASVTLPLNGIMPWSASNELVAAADDSIRDLELQLLSARTTADLKKASLLRDITQSQSSLEARGLNVTLAEKSHALTEEAYRRGAKDLLTLQNAADALQLARVSQMKESYTLISAVLDLEYAIGVPFGTLGRTK
jgi:outer membrane protein